jgi:hypothetical protein
MLPLPLPPLPAELKYLDGGRVTRAMVSTSFSSVHGKNKKNFG